MNAKRRHRRIRRLRGKFEEIWTSYVLNGIQVDLKFQFFEGKSTTQGPVIRRVFIV